MSNTATITSKPLMLRESRPQGTAISDEEWWQIEPDNRTAPPRFKTIWLAEILDEISRLARLPAGWDSYGADPPDAEIVSAARKLIVGIADPFLGLPRPNVVTATRSGGIQFEWGVHGSAYFELELVKSAFVEYLFVDRRQGVELEGSADIQSECNFIGEVANHIRSATQDR